jgi:hypothetical protein
MLFDVFISHASEDKDDLVRPLAGVLQQNRVEVWYDEFSLRAGDSLRRSIDIGLSKCRYGVVVLSKNFFRKNWPQWELDGLVQRQNSEGRQLILPVWHGVTRADVLEYSPSLADKVAVESKQGLDHVVNELLKVLQPEGSTLLIARDVLIQAGCNPPVVTDDWWLDVVAASATNPMEGGFQEAMGWGHWGFPLPPSDSRPANRGLRLAQAAMQMLWQQEAERQRLSQVSSPEQVLEFIRSQPGLAVTCEDYLPYLAAYAPQLTIRGCGGEFEELFEDWYRNSIKGNHARRAKGDKTGTALTKNGLPPKTEEILALRDPSFGDYSPALISCHFVQGDIMGPPVRVYETIDYVAWFLSDESSWMPTRVRRFLIEGLKEWAVWLWHHPTNDVRSLGVDENPIYGSLLHEMDNAKSVARFKLSEKARQDIEARMQASAMLLKLKESGTTLAKRFLDQKFIEKWFDEQQKIHRRVRDHETKRERAKHCERGKGRN